MSKAKFPIDMSIVEDNPFHPPLELPCPQCGGDLEAVINCANTLVLVDCVGECRLPFKVPLVKERQ